MALTAPLGAALDKIDFKVIGVSNASGSGPKFSPVKIQGANYASFDTGDGFITIKNVPIFGEVKKGDHDAPEDIGAKHHAAFVAKAQELYKRGKFAAPVIKGHNKLLAITDPEFLGFYLPTHIGRMEVNGENQSVVYADLKVKLAAFEKALKGELPYLSVEADWRDMTLEALSFLDSRPPHFKFPIFTVLPPVKDDSGKFEVKLMNLAMFEKESKAPAKEKPEEGGEKEPDKKAAPFEAKDKGEEGKEVPPGGAPPADGGAADAQGGVPSWFAPYAHGMATMMKMMGLPFMGIEGADGKLAPAQVPAEQTPAPDKSNMNQEKTEQKKESGMADEKDKAKMESGKAGAQFAAYEGRIAALEEKTHAQDEKDRIAGLVSKAESDLKGYPLSEDTKGRIAKFAKMGEEALKEFVAAFKETAQKDAPGTKAAFEADPTGGLMSHPLVAKFQAKGPDQAEAAARALSEWNQLSKIKGFTVSAENHLKFRVPELLAKRG